MPTFNFCTKATHLNLFVLLSAFFLVQYTHASAQPLTKGTGTLKVLAVMVEFQEDDNEFTSGNGLFGPGSLPYMENEDIKIDPLPHNFSYFDAHLSFVKNWYSRASNNQLAIDYTLLPTTYKLGLPMASYSPTGEDFDFELLATLVKDVWTAVDEGPELNLDWNPDEQTALVIFHAGVGRDIELIGTILDKTYQDIPSIYMSRNALNEYANIINPDLFRIKNGSIPITNSLIIPRTLSRRGELFEEEQVVSFSINGLLVASIASHIGLPDLFNTENGRSAIGQFGLMDGAGFILSYNGLFPPLPSAWERIKLGWEVPFLINDKVGEEISLVAAGSAQNSNSTIAKYEITKDEYFLFENRFRDANSTGVELTYRLPDGSTATQKFTNTDSVFSGQYADFDSLLIRGVLIDVDNPDFALPGGLDYGNDRKPGTDDDRELNGGVLIWHINESVIKANPTAVNADDQNRGVDLEEADGAQDIGFPIDGSIVDLSSGHAYDFWWAGNDYRVITEVDTIRNYQNRFGLDTRPNSNNQAGGATFFEAFDFSDSQAIASFRYTNTSNTSLERISRRPINTEFIVGEGQNTFKTNTSIRYYESNNQRLVTTFANSTVTVYDASSPEVFTDLVVNGTVYSAQITRAAIEGSTPLLVVLSIGANSNLTIDAYQIRPDLSLSKLWETTYSLSAITLPKNALTQSGTFLKNLFGTFKLNLENGTVTSSSDIEPLIIRANEGSTLSINQELLTSLNIQSDEVVGAVALNRDESPNFAIFNEIRTWILNKDGVLIKDLIRAPISSKDPENIQIPSYSLPAFADLSKDGNIDIVQANASGTALHAYNSSGTELDGFPISLDAYKLKVNGPLLITENTQTNSYNIIFEGTNDQKSYMLSINTSNAKMQPLFPLTLASPIRDNAVTNKSSAIIVGSPAQFHFLRYDGIIEQWNLNEEDRPLWGSAFGNTADAKFSTLSESMVDNGSESELLLNLDETYNWPNPVRSGQTSIRYQSKTGATINVLVAQPSGKIVHKTTFEVGSSLPESYPLNTSTWASGVYLVNITASLNGQDQKKIIKMVVVQ